MQNKETSATIALGTYEGSLLVYKIDLVKGVHIPQFSAKDNIVSKKILKNVGLYQGSPR